MISFPADKVNLENLRKLLASKSELIKKALEVEAFPIEEHDDQISFPSEDYRAVGAECPDGCGV